jgi:hypothetical protein
MVIKFSVQVNQIGNVTHEFLVLAMVVDADVRLGSLVENFEGEVLNIGLNLSIIIFSANQSLGVENTS